MDDLRGKVCLVTGASTGIGPAVARALGAHGASVALHYHRSADQPQRVAEDICASGSRAVLLRGDVGDPAVAGHLVAQTAAAFGRLDVLINILASERLSSYVTGQVLEVNGGQFMP